MRDKKESRREWPSAILFLSLMILIFSTSCSQNLHPEQTTDSGNPVNSIDPAVATRVAKQQTGLNAATRAMMLEDTRRILAKEDAVADAVHRRTFGEDYMPPSEKEMGEIHVGDKITYQTPTPVASESRQSSSHTQQNPLASMLIGAAITAAMGGAAGYYLAPKNNVTQPTSPPVEFQDETISVGLGKIEDYLSERP